MRGNSLGPTYELIIAGKDARISELERLYQNERTLVDRKSLRIRDLNEEILRLRAVLADTPEALDAIRDETHGVLDAAVRDVVLAIRRLADWNRECEPGEPK
jgi:hypothetical protein